jgi:hypothetical protein
MESGFQERIWLPALGMRLGYASQLRTQMYVRRSNSVLGPGIRNT